jgi:two-component system sensor histidine kinase CpxA
MRSLYLSIALVMAGTLALTLFAFGLISAEMDRQYIVPVFEAMDQLQLESARTALANGGRTSLGGYMAELDRKFGPNHYLVDSQGVDVVSRSNLAAFLPAPPADRSRGFLAGRFVVTRKASDGRYWLVSVGPEKGQPWLFRPYALVAIAMTAVLSLAAAFGLVRPIRRLTKAVQRFGRGELTARAQSRRKDEIGVLTQSFDEMADRIERLVTSERRLLQDISHELRSPLARLKLAVKLARTASDRDTAHDRIERDIDRITALTAELVEMTRGETHALQREAVDLKQLIGEAIEDCNSNPPQSIRCDIPVSSEITCDRGMMRRVIENVLNNALQHTTTGSAIDVTVSRDGDNAIIIIRDYGPGVPDDALDEIFAPFYRVDEARHATSGGLGLGLAIARSIVHRHGGTITAQNASPGLAVTIILPHTIA